MDRRRQPKNPRAEFTRFLLSELRSGSAELAALTGGGEVEYGVDSCALTQSLDTATAVTTNQVQLKSHNTT
jgi:hypothetical protein